MLANPNDTSKPSWLLCSICHSWPLSSYRRALCAWVLHPLLLTAWQSLLWLSYRVPELGSSIKHCWFSGFWSGPAPLLIHKPLSILPWYQLANTYCSHTSISNLDISLEIFDQYKIQDCFDLWSGEKHLHKGPEINHIFYFCCLTLDKSASTSEPCFLICKRGPLKTTLENYGKIIFLISKNYKIKNILLCLQYKNTDKAKVHPVSL